MDHIVPAAPVSTRLVIRRHVDFALVHSALCSGDRPAAG